jgi:hypothetical protein
MKTLEVLEEMFLDYVRGESFGDLTEEGRNDCVNAYEELKELATSAKPIDNNFIHMVN